MNSLAYGWVHSSPHRRLAPALAGRRRHSRRDPVLVAAEIDPASEAARLTALRVPLAPQADDAEFLHRAALDLTVAFPTTRSDGGLSQGPKRRPAHAADRTTTWPDPWYRQRFAVGWYHRMINPDDDNSRLIIGNTTRDWLADRFNQNQPWDRLVTDLLTASANATQTPRRRSSGPRCRGAAGPSKMTAAAGACYLGVRLELLRVPQPSV